MTSSGETRVMSDDSAIAATISSEVAEEKPPRNDSTASPCWPCCSGTVRTNYRALAERGEKRVNLKSNGKPVGYKIGLKVDSAGELPDGSEFDDVNEFRSLLKARSPQIARNLLEQFVVYATGTPVSFGDHQTVESMMASLARNNYGVRSMIHEVVQSELFRRK